MFEIELRSPEEMSIKSKDRTIIVNVAQSVISANGLDVGKIKGAGEFEIGDATIVGLPLGNRVMYRVEIGGVRIGLVGETEKVDELDELGPVDILGTSSLKVVGIVEPKIVIPMGSMDYSELKAEMKVEKKLRVKNEGSLPSIMEVWKLD